MSKHLSIATGAVFFILFMSSPASHGQGETLRYISGYESVELLDTSRNYYPDTISRSLHKRPIALDIFYPAIDTGTNKILFKDLLTSLERRANLYQDETDYTGLTDEMAQYYILESGGSAADIAKLLEIKTNLYVNSHPSKSKFPIILYMAGFNGMAFENYKLLETLAANGFVVVSISSVGRYPGDMTNQKLDILEQVYDAEFALKYLASQNEFNVDLKNIGVIGYSWGGMSSAIFAERNSPIAFISLDGSETHYLGASQEDDSLLSEIQRTELVVSDQQDLKYLFLESGSRLANYYPSGEYHYYKKVNTKEKYYLRFTKSKHEDFSCLASMLQTQKESQHIHQEIIHLSVSFFQQFLKGADRFNAVFDLTRSNKDVASAPMVINFNLKSSLVLGQIVDSKSGLPLAFASIGILNRDIGTISSDSGNYSLAIRSDMANDTIKISMIGYESKILLVSELVSKKWSKIELEQKDQHLDEIVVTAAALRKKTIGNKTTSRFMSAAFSYDQLGAEMGIKINIRHAPTFIDAFHFHVAHNRLHTKAWFRLNMYSIANGKPSRYLLTENILIPVDAQQTGMISVDLKPYNIILQDDAIATLEWIKNDEEASKGEAIYFSLGVFNGGTLVKRASQGKFKKFSSMGVGMTFEARY
jgi:dienelactone hydrolase